MTTSPIKIIAFLGAFALLGACSTAPVDENGIRDPYEDQNRGVHEENKKLDTILFRPVAVAYGETTPDPLRQGVNNFVSNLDQPGYVVNNLLQLRLGAAVQNTARFVVNTTVGIGGLFDPASAMGLDARDTDFGETLFVWGVPEGNFVELPILGPSTERHMVGRVVDVALNPTRMLVGDLRTANSVGSVASGLDTRYRFRVTIDGVLYESVDSYDQSRLLYLQNRRFKLGDTDSIIDIEPYEELGASAEN